MIVAGGVSALLALVVSYPLLRIRGWYFAIGTWAFAEIVRTLIMNNPQVTRGAEGIFVPYINFPAPFSPAFEFLMPVILGFATLMMYKKLLRSKVGLAMEAIRGNFEAARMVGINTTLFRALIFALSGFIAGIAGGYFAMYKQYVDPVSAFEMSWIVKIIVIAMLGGAFTVAGPLVGSIFVLVLEEIGRTLFVRGSLLLLAIVLIITLIVMPGGIMGTITGKVPLRNPYKSFRKLFKHERAQRKASD